MTFDLTTRRAIMKELEESAKKIAKKYGVDAKFGGGTYDNTSYNLKMEFFSIEGKKEESESAAVLVGLPPDVIGKAWVNSKGVYMTISGINLRRPKNCIELKGSDGMSYKCDVDMVKRALKL